MARILVPISYELPWFFLGLECALRVGLNVPEMQRVLEDSLEDLVSVKSYVFHDSKIRISGLVEEYEPETMWISVDGSRLTDHQLEEIAGAAASYARRTDSHEGRGA